MKDRIPTPGKENRVRITQDNGQVIEGVFEYADDATQEGSFYNKANVLPDEVCDYLDIDRQTAEPKEGFLSLFNMINRLSQSVTYSEVISYVGTGTYGTSNPSIITFENAPDYVLFLGYAFAGQGGLTEPGKISTSNLIKTALIADNITTEYVSGNGFGYEPYGKKSADGKTFSWYSTTNAKNQANGSDTSYWFMGVKS